MRSASVLRSPELSRSAGTSPAPSGVPSRAGHLIVRPSSSAQPVGPLGATRPASLMTVRRPYPYTSAPPKKGAAAQVSRRPPSSPFVWDGQERPLSLRRFRPRSADRQSAHQRKCSRPAAESRKPETRPTTRLAKKARASPIGREGVSFRRSSCRGKP